MEAAISTANQAAQEIGAVVQGTRRKAQLISSIPMVIRCVNPAETQEARELARASVVKVLQDCRSALPDVESLFILDDKGTITAALNPAVVGESRASRPCFQGVMQGKALAEGPLMSVATGKPAYTIINPIMAGGKAVGAIVVNIDLGSLHANVIAGL